MPEWVRFLSYSFLLLLDCDVEVDEVRNHSLGLNDSYLTHLVEHRVAMIQFIHGRVPFHLFHLDVIKEMFIHLLDLFHPTLLFLDLRILNSSLVLKCLLVDLFDSCHLEVLDGNASLRQFVVSSLPEYVLIRDRVMVHYEIRVHLMVVECAILTQEVGIIRDVYIAYHVSVDVTIQYH